MVLPNYNVPTKSILLSKDYFSQLSLKILPGKIKNQLAESSFETDLVGFPKTLLRSSSLISSSSKYLVEYHIDYLDNLYKTQKYPKTLYTNARTNFVAFVILLFLRQIKDLLMDQFHVKYVLYN